MLFFSPLRQIALVKDAALELPLQKIVSGTETSFSTLEIRNVPGCLAL